jgi:hypothetical protein
MRARDGDAAVGDWRALDAVGHRREAATRDRRAIEWLALAVAVIALASIEVLEQSAAHQAAEQAAAVPVLARAAPAAEVATQAGEAATLVGAGVEGRQAIGRITGEAARGAAEADGKRGERLLQQQRPRAAVGGLAARRGDESCGSGECESGSASHGACLQVWAGGRSDPRCRIPLPASSSRTRDSNCTLPSAQRSRRLATVRSPGEHQPLVPNCS